MAEKQPKKAPVRTNSLMYYALKYKNGLTATEEIQNIDMTEVFYAELDHMLINEERINVSCIGKTGGGKSTLQIANGLYTHNRTVDLKIVDKKEKFGIKKIMRSQHEFDKFNRNPENYNTTIVVDEFTAADETGQDISTIQAVRTQISDVHAQRKIRCFSASPTQIMDKNSDIILEVVQSDPKRMMTRCWLYYRLVNVDAGLYPQLLGYVDINVAPVLQNWIGMGVKELFFKPNKTEKELEELAKWKQNDFYVEYVIRKFEKMDMLTKEKVFRERELDEAEVVVNVVKELIPFTKLNFLTSSIVESYSKIYAKRSDMPQSILGSKLTSDKISSILKFWEAYWKLNKELDKLDSMKAKEKINKQEYELRKEEITKLRHKLITGVSILQEEYEHLLEIRQKYNKIESG